MTPETSDTPEDRELRMIEDRLWARVSLVENQARALRWRLRLTGLALVAVVALIGVLVYRPELLAVRGIGVGEVRTSSLVLVDGQGRTRGQWTIDEEGNSRLFLLDQEGRTRLRLSVLEDGSPGMSLINAEGRSRAAFGLLPDETTTLVFADGAGVARAILGLSGGEAANLLLADAEGVSRLGFGVDANGAASAVLPPELTEGASEEGTQPEGS